MSSLTLDLDDDLMAVLRQSDRSAPHVARELMVTELYRRGVISSGKAAEVLGIPRLEFIQYASELGIPYFQMSEEEWAAEKRQLEDL